MLTTHGSRLTRAAVAATSSAASFISASQPSRVSACKALHQRRPSSSKASCPPDNSHKGTRSAAAAPATASTSKQSPQSVRPASSGRSSTPRQTRAKKARDGSWVGVRNQKDQSSTAFKDLPRVASTNNIRPIDITLSSFFSLHRPISLDKPLPPQASMEAFERIFQPASEAVSKPSDVIYNLSNAIGALESHRESIADSADLRWEIVDEGSSQDGLINHLDAAPRTRSLDEVVSHLRPYSTPPPPQPLDSHNAQKSSKSSQKSRSQTELESAANDRSFKTTIYLHEMTGHDGTKSYYAQSTPVVQIEPETESGAMAGEVSEAVASETDAAEQREISDQRQPFLNRMRRRQRRHDTAIKNRVTAVRRDAPGAGVANEMLAISVKRQRKLKMKKHKYKKLMRKTRNLRRKLEKN